MGDTQWRSQRFEAAEAPPSYNTRIRHFLIPPDDPDAKLINAFPTVKILATVRHPAIVPMIGWNVRIGEPGSDSPTEVLVATKFIQHGSLKDRPRLDATGRMIVIYGAAGALLHLHSVGVCHGQVGLDSIFLDESNHPHLTSPDPDCWSVVNKASDVRSLASVIRALVPGRWINLAGLLSRIDSGDARNGPEMGEVVLTLEEPNNWLSRTDRNQFLSYKVMLDSTSPPALRVFNLGESLMALRGSLPTIAGMPAKIAQVVGAMNGAEFDSEG
jgi:serine/threonine protein kinase